MAIELTVTQDYQADCVVILFKGQFNWYKKVEPLTFFQDTTLTPFESYVKHYNFNESLKAPIEFLASFTSKPKILKLMRLKFQEALEDKIDDSKALAAITESLVKILDERWEQTPFDKLVCCQGKFKASNPFANVPEFDTAKLSEKLPGVNKTVKFPCKCEPPKHRFEDTLFRVIIHLNDEVKWSREAIADWIESLDVNTEFKVPKEGL